MKKKKEGIKMSTNYYFKVKNVDKIAEQFKALSPLITQEMIDNVVKKLGKIHISQTNGKWKPLFESQEYFKNIKELGQFYQTYKDQLTIESEYGVIFTWDEFKDYMTSDNSISKSRRELHDEYVDLTDKFYVDDEGFEWLTGEFC